MQTMQWCALSVALTLGIVWILSSAAHRDEQLMYIGDCVDIVAQREGMHGTPREKWDAFAGYCVERYQDR